MTLIRVGLVGLLLAAAMSCAPASSDPAGAHRPAEIQTSEVQHVVICWLKRPGDEAARHALIGATRSFADLPGVTSIRVGRAMPSTRPVVDSSYDVALVMTFRDEQSLAAYEAHPKHQRAVQDVLRPLVARYVIYDFVDRP